MTIMNLHFAAGMFFGLVICSLLYFKFKDIPLYTPLIMTIFGIWAIMPSILSNFFGISFNSNIFLFSPILDAVLPKGQYIGFLFTIFLYNVGIVGQIIHLRK